MLLEKEESLETAFGPSDALGTLQLKRLRETDYKIDGINGWLGLWGIDHAQSLEASEELLASSNEATEHATGLSFDMTEQVESDGTTYHVGSYLDSEGRAVVRVVECDGAIHWPTPAMSDQALDFLNQFSK